MTAPSSRRPRLPAEAVEFRQRARILDATARSVAELGYADCSVEHVAQRAGVSKRTFYARFRSKEHAVAEAYAAAAAHARQALRAAMADVEEGERALAAGVAAYVGLLQCDLAWARFCVVEAPAAGSSVTAQRNAFVDDVLVALRRTAPSGAAGSIDARLVVEAVDGAVRGWLSQAHPQASAQALIRQLTSLALAFCSGGRGRVAAAPDPRRPAGAQAAAPTLDDALDRLPCPAAVDHITQLVDAAAQAGDGQFLWRAVVELPAAEAPGLEQEMQAVQHAAAAALRDASIFGLVRSGALAPAEWDDIDQRERCLRFVAAHPGASGAQVRRALGVRDPAQVSRLLAGLEADGLIETPRPRTGRANAWRLTPAGARSRS